MEDSIGLIYGRVSTGTQDTEEFQKQYNLTHFPPELNITIPNGYIFYDDARSGTEMTRRANLQKALELCRQKKVRYFIIYKVSRAFRNIKDAINTFDELKKLGIDFISTGDGINTSTAMGKYFFMFASIFAEMERDNISKYTGDVLSHKMHTGINCSKCPFGYKKAAGKGKKGGGGIAVDIVQAAIVKSMFSRYASGDSIPTLSKDFDFPCFKVINVLSNPIYCGFRLYNSDIIPFPVEALITIEEYKSVIRKLAHLKVAHRKWKCVDFIDKFEKAVADASG